MKSIAICISKGGQYKTCLTCNMAALLNEKGKKTLVIDTDPQCSSTLLYGAKSEGEYTIYDCWLDTRRPANPMECIQHTNKGDIIAGDALLSELTAKVLQQQLKIDSLSKVLDQIEGYDYILIDCPPDITGLINKSVISAVDEIISPMFGDLFSINGLANLVKLVNVAKESVNPKLKINGIVLTQFQGNTKSGKNALENAIKIAAQLNTRVYDAKIRACAKGKEAVDNSEFVVEYAPYCNSSLDYKKFVDEFLRYEEEK